MEPTVRRRADLGYIPIVVGDAYGAGNADAPDRSMAIRFIGDAIITDHAVDRDVLPASRERQ
jgi:hypothetical protein